MAPRIRQTDHPDAPITRKATNGRAHATSTSYQYLFANAVEIEPIDKDLFAEIIEAQKTDKLATELLGKLDRRGRDHVIQEGLTAVT
jgi:hypothetical protein